MHPQRRNQGFCPHVPPGTNAVVPRGRMGTSPKRPTDQAVDRNAYTSRGRVGAHLRDESRVHTHSPKQFRCETATRFPIDQMKSLFALQNPSRNVTSNRVRHQWMAYPQVNGDFSWPELT